MLICIWQRFFFYSHKPKLPALCLPGLAKGLNTGGDRRLHGGVSAEGNAACAGETQRRVRPPSLPSSSSSGPGRTGGPAPGTASWLRAPPRPAGGGTGRYGGAAHGRGCTGAAPHRTGPGCAVPYRTGPGCAVPPRTCCAAETSNTAPGEWGWGEMRGAAAGWVRVRSAGPGVVGLGAASAGGIRGAGDGDGCRGWGAESAGQGPGVVGLGCWVSVRVRRQDWGCWI